MTTDQIIEQAFAEAIAHYGYCPEIGAGYATRVLSELWTRIEQEIANERRNERLIEAGSLVDRFIGSVREMRAEQQAFHDAGHYAETGSLHLMNSRRLEAQVDAML